MHQYLLSSLEPIRKWDNRLQTRPFGQFFRFLSTNSLLFALKNRKNCLKMAHFRFDSPSSYRLLLFLFIMPSVSQADIIKLETNVWSNKRPIVWSGTLLSIDPQSNLAHFEYKNKDTINTFSVHLTRIYSLTLDSQDRVNRPFPKTRKDITTELPINPRTKKVLELSNKNFVADDIPENVKVRGHQDSLVIYLNGRVVSADLENIVLQARAKQRQQETFSITRSDFRKWIR